MDWRIQFCTTSDGLRIAYGATGQGSPPIIAVTPGLLSPIKWAERDPQVAASVQEFSQKVRRQCVFYDRRGTGLSDRGISDFSREAVAKDIEAIVGNIGAEQVVIWGFDFGTPAALEYAHRNPGRVTHLLLYAPYRRGEDLASRQVQTWVVQTFRGMKEGAEIIPVFSMPGVSPESARAYSAALRDTCSGECAAAQMEAAYREDVTELLSKIEVPTLVLHTKASRVVPFRLGREVAALIANSSFVALDLETHTLLTEDMTHVTDAVGEFLSPMGWERPTIPDTTASGTAVILFADIADSTALTERLGDATFREKARELDGTLRGIIRENAGTPIEGKLLGDGVLAVFTSARQAIEAALACAVAGNDGGLPLHLGLHAGDVIREDNNVYGGAVNIASRISGLSAPGEMLVSDIVRGLARTSAGVRFEDRGEQALKGVGDLVRVWAVREAE